MTYDNIVDICQVLPECGEGFTLNIANNRCERPFICNPGQTPNVPIKSCQFAPTFVCNTSGYQFNSTTGRCTKDPVCPDVSAMNYLTDKCEQTPEYIGCPIGWLYNSTKAMCEKALTCPAGTGAVGAAYSSATIASGTAVSLTSVTSTQLVFTVTGSSASGITCSRRRTMTSLFGTVGDAHGYLIEPLRGYGLTRKNDS